MVFFHGSGFVLCSLDTHDGMCRNLCAGAECVVASLDHRLAPEDKFPAGIEDSLHATRWAAAYGRINSTWTLPNQVGWSIAKELLFSARVVEAEDAYRIGLLNHRSRASSCGPRLWSLPA